MPMGDTEGLPSLLPYLDGRSAGISLKFDFSDQPSEAAVPCEPFSTVRRARIMLDGRSTIMSLIVLSQADNYIHDSSELFPFTNEDIEKSWQQAWRKMADSDTGKWGPNLPTVLPTQVDANGLLVPLRPLFYCCFRKRYSHPLCPFCGEDLELCQDDDLLKKAALPIYSSSLMRFLYCPSCHGIDPDALFYQFPDAHEPTERVRGVQQLIEGFSRLLTKEVLAEDLTCVGCPQAMHCFGDEALALQRMTVVQFYPFHLMLLHDSDMNAADFCALLSGAELKDVKAHSILKGKIPLLPSFAKEEIDYSNRSGFLFFDDHRFFLEVLYLKLSFLDALWRLLNEDPFGAVPNRTLEQVGVAFSRIRTRMPYFWHFSLHWIDPVGRPVSGAVVSSLSPMLIQEFFVRAWFYVLLVNPRQNMANVLASLTEFHPYGDAGTDKSQAEPYVSLAPENLFWTPLDIQIESDWMALWESTLQLGTQLLRADNPFLSADVESPTFSDKLERLINQVHQILFQSPAHQSAAGKKRIKSTDPTDKSIAAILESILEKWPTESVSEIRQSPVGKPVEEFLALRLKPNADSDNEETVVLTDHEALVDLEKTFVQPLATAKTDAHDPESPLIVSKPDTSGDNLLEATLVLQSGCPLPTADPTEKKQTSSVAENNAEKTVVMDKSFEQADMDDLEQTVVQRSHDDQGPHLNQPQMSKAYPLNGPDVRANDDNDLEATIVQNLKNRGKDGNPKT